MTINDMRYELERFMVIPNDTPDDMVMGLYQCYKMATDKRLPDHVRLTFEAVFSIFESANVQWDIQYQQINAALNRNAEFADDLVGRWLDENDNQL